ncbi:hypothetical protein J437_LFUL011275 [Ladona fulva]|uniref:Uncharacterized protein n=1 Tax=Ladona fulva TaxID=123851 RepID=A0A8K0P8P1_LADFU|nr:hypothetical protein J437_LFUL011275 [Ladona fulva]
MPGVFSGSSNYYYRPPQSSSTFPGQEQLLHIDLSQRLLAALTLRNREASPLAHLGGAALLGLSSRGRPDHCYKAFPECPQSPDALLDYLNNHRGGFFRALQPLRIFSGQDGPVNRPPLGPLGPIYPRPPLGPGPHPGQNPPLRPGPLGPIYPRPPLGPGPHPGQNPPLRPGPLGPIYPRPPLGPGPHLGQNPPLRPGPHLGQNPFLGPGPHLGQNPFLGPGPHLGQNPFLGPGPHLGQNPSQGPGPHQGQYPPLRPGPQLDQNPPLGPRPILGPRPPFAPGAATQPQQPIGFEQQLSPRPLIRREENSSEESSVEGEARIQTKPERLIGAINVVQPVFWRFPDLAGLQPNQKIFPQSQHSLVLQGNRKGKKEEAVNPLIVPTIFPDRTGTGDLRLDNSELFSGRPDLLSGTRYGKVYFPKELPRPGEAISLDLGPRPILGPRPPFAPGAATQPQQPIGFEQQLSPRPLIRREENSSEESSVEGEARIQTKPERLIGAINVVQPVFWRFPDLAGLQPNQKIFPQSQHSLVLQGNRKGKKEEAVNPLIVPTIFPDRTGTGDLRLDNSELFSGRPDLLSGTRYGKVYFPKELPRPGEVNTNTRIIVLFPGPVS